MMEENNNIFLACGDALVYLAEPIHTKYCATFVWGLPFSTYVSCDQYFYPLPSRSTHPFPQLRTYLMDGLYLNQKTNKNIQISHSLKYKHSKTKLFTKK